MSKKENLVMLLSDEQLVAFIREGIVTVRVPMDDTFTNNLVDELKRPSALRAGNNLLPTIPALGAVVQHPVLRGAVESILGPAAVLQPHRYAHTNFPGRDGQAVHRDSFYNYQKVRSPLPWELIVFYFPHDVPVEQGPTAYYPRSQYSDTVPNTPPVHKAIPAGTAMICNYGLWHCGTRNSSDDIRCMVKFQFARMDSVATWVTAQAAQMWAGFGEPLRPHEQLVLAWYLNSAPPASVGRPPLGGGGLEDACAAVLNGDARGLVAQLHAPDQEWDSKMKTGSWRDFDVLVPNKGMAAAVAIAIWPVDSPREIVEGLMQTLRDGVDDGEWPKYAAAVFAAFAAGPHLARSPELLKFVCEMIPNVPPGRSFLTVTLAEALKYTPASERDAACVALLPLVQSTHRKPQSRFTAAMSLAALMPLDDAVVKELHRVGVSAPDRYSRAFALIATKRAADITSASANRLMERRVCPFVVFHPYADVNDRQVPNEEDTQL